MLGATGTLGSLRGGLKRQNKHDPSEAFANSSAMTGKRNRKQLEKLSRVQTHGLGAEEEDPGKHPRLLVGAPSPLTPQKVSPRSSGECQNEPEVQPSQKRKILNWLKAIEVIHLYSQVPVRSTRGRYLPPGPQISPTVFHTL